MSSKPGSTEIICIHTPEKDHKINPQDSVTQWISTIVAQISEDAVNISESTTTDDKLDLELSSGIASQVDSSSIIMSSPANNVFTCSPDTKPGESEDPSSYPRQTSNIPSTSGHTTIPIPAPGSYDHLPFVHKER